MTKAAIATRTLRSPRRRHPPGPAWERAGAWSLLGLWVFAMARTIVRGDHGLSSEAAS
jgi:hypothetical protein